MSAAEPYVGRVNEDGSFTILGLITARVGTGVDAPDPTEGKLIKQADLTSITIAVYDPLGDVPDTPLFTVSPMIADVIYDTLQTTGVWGLLSNGGNFLYDVPATWVPNGGQSYRIQAKFTTVDGAVAWGLWEPEVTELMGS